MPDIIQRSFTGGELSPAMRVRTDLNKYSTSLAVCENFIVRAQGGVYSRPGTKFVGYLASPNKRARLIPFSFNTEQTYVLVFEHLTMRVVMDGGFVLSGMSAYTITTPYTEDDLPRLMYVQDADVMTIVHPDYAPATISRTGHAAWSHDYIDFSPTILPPAFVADVGKTVTGITNATPCVVTCTAHGAATGQRVTVSGGITELDGNTYTITVVNANSFTLDGVDSTTYAVFSGPCTATIIGSANPTGDGAGDYDKTYTYVVTTVSETGVESVASAPVSLTTKSLSTTAGVVLSWVAVTGADYYRVYKDPSNNTGIYGWIGDTQTTVFTDFNIAPLTSDAPPQNNEPFGSAGNYPSTVGYYQQRQIFANTTNEPQTVFTTQVGYYNSMRSSVPSRADDAITFTIKNRQVNAVRHIVSLDSLILLTSGSEYKVTEGQDQVLTPSTMGVRAQSYNGASWIPPVVVNDSVIYIQDRGSRFRDIKYDFASDKYAGGDLSLLAEHLFENYEIEELAYSQEPYGILWAVRDDGVLLGLTYQRDHQVFAWHHHVTDGEFESVAVITEGNIDALYCTVKRVIDGVTTRYVERFESRITTSSSDVYCVDCGITYTGVATTTITGLDHLDGETVRAVCDGAEVTGLVVSGGSVTLPRAASKVSIGLPFTPVIETLDVDTPTAMGSIRASDKSVSKVVMEVEDSRGGWVGPKLSDGSVSTMTEIKPRFDADGYGPIPLRTFKQEVFIDPQWGTSGGLRVEQRSAFPLTILTMIPTVDVS